MKGYSENTTAGKYGGSTNRNIILFEEDESNIIYEALQEYCENHKRKRKAKKVLTDLGKLV